MKSEKSTKQIVLDAIKKANPPYVTIQEIADVTTLSRETVSKYILVLAAERKIKITKTVGKVNLYEAM
jgi:response regulator of citrate/malate metabolism